MPADLVVLKQVPFLRSLNDSELKDLVPLLEIVEKEPEDILFRQGERGNSLYFICKGRVRFTFHHDTGESGTFEEIGPGQFFGEVAVFTLDGVRTATAEVTESFLAYELKRDDLIRYLNDHPDAALHLLGGMAERLRRSGRQLEHAPVRNVNTLIKETLTTQDRMAKGVARFAGSPAFLLVHVLFLSVWITLNVWPGRAPFDEPPFHRLALILGIEALVLSCFVLMNQFREDKAVEQRNNEEFTINVAARKGISDLQERMDDLHRELLARLPAKDDNDR